MHWAVGGIYEKATLRATIRGRLGKQKGVQVRGGYYGDREMDLITLYIPKIDAEDTKAKKDRSVFPITSLRSMKGSAFISNSF